jgi:osmotically inducible protein OsmC
VSHGALDASAQRQLDAVARRVRKLRFDRGLRLLDVAAMTGLSEVHLYRLEKGERAPSLRTLLVVAAAYGIDPGKLIGAETADDDLLVAHGARAHWRGDEISGAGTMASSGVCVRFNHQSRTHPTPDGGADGDRAVAETSSPESLIGMALAGCFSMSLAERLKRDGSVTAERIETLATVGVRSADETISISEIVVRCEVVVSAIDPDRFQALARTTLETCVVARALSAVPTRLEAHLLDAAEHAG